MNQKDTIEIWCFLHSSVDGVLTVSPAIGLANHCRIPASMVDFQVSADKPQQILMRIPTWLAAGFGLYRPPAPASTVEKPRTQAAGAARPTTRGDEYEASVDGNGDMHLHRNTVGEIVGVSTSLGGHGGILESGRIVRSKAEQIRQEAKQVGGL